MNNSGQPIYGMSIARPSIMNSHLDIGLSSWSGKNIKLPEQGSTQTPASSFQQYLDRNKDSGLPLSPETLTPDAIRSLAATLISVLDRASMDALFFDTNSGSEPSPSSLLSTDLFLAMRNNTVTSRLPVQDNPAQVSATASEPAVIKTEKPVVQEVVSSGSAREQYTSIIASAAASYGLDPKLIEAVVQTESNFNAQAVSPVGAQGLMQLMPGTAAELGVTDVFNPEQNIQAGSKYLKQLMDRYDGDAGLALAAYNWGMGNLERHPERMPQETVDYVAKITGLMNKTA